jgi:putative CocE/NonD family hydrolase
MQPGVAALHPKGLDAIAPWQIVDDVYRDVAFPGGVGNGEFGAFWGLGDQPAASYSSQLNGTTAGDPQCAQSSAGQLAANPPTNIFVAGYQHQYMDSFWSSKTIGEDASKIAVPALGCVTWQDDEVGSRSTWTLWPRLDPKRTWVVTANGYHAQCTNSTPINDELVRFFDRYVKGERNGFESTPHMQMWHETSGVTDAKPSWTTSSSTWPPATKTKKLYLRTGGALSRMRPAAAEAEDTYVSPTVSAGTEDGIVFGQGNRLWKLPGTPGGAVAYTTPKLARTLELLGPLSLNLWLKSTATDTNLQATITEVRPDGQELYVQRGWLTASQRKLDTAASTPTMPVQTNREADVQPLALGQPTFMRLAIMPVDHVFRAGSRLRLIIDTPSQTGGWNWQPVKSAGVNSILHDAAHRSELVFGTVRGATAPAAYPQCDTLLNQPCRPDAFK